MEFYDYDAHGRLCRYTDQNGKLIQFLYRGRDVVAETTEDGSIIRYIRGNRLISSDNEKARCYYHYVSDEMGSITHIIKDAVKRKLAEECSASDMDGAAQDETGQGVSRACIVNRYEYDAFGNTVTCEETVPNRFRFAGEQYDQITQQYYLRARFYNPVIGRFLQEDDYYGDGLNLYAYCRNNPVSYVDPSGHGTESAPDKNPDNNSKDLHDLVDDINNGSGASPSDIDAIKSLAEEFGLDPSEFDVKSSKEVNQQALKDLVDEVNQAGGASPSEKKILKEFAEEYGMDYDSLGVKEAGRSGNGNGGKADLGNKMDYLFGKATGNKHNIERSKGMQAELQKIGIHDTPSGREYISKHLADVLNDPSNISKVETRTYVAKELPNQPIIEYTATTRESLLMGPGGAVKVESVWDGNRLLTVVIKGGS